MSGPVILAFCIWMLLTADSSWPNVVMGLAASLLVARFFIYPFSALQFFSFLLSFFLRFFQATWEALLILCLPHRYERITRYQVPDARNPWAVFSRAMVLTFTPKSLVIRTREKGVLELHRLERKEDSS